MSLKITPGMSRIFVATELTDAARAALNQTQEDLIRRILPLHILDPADLHLTMVFLGEVLPNQIQRLIDSVGDVCAVIEPFQLRITGIDTGRKERQTDTLWASIAPDSPGLPILVALREQLVERLQKAEFATDPSTYPHVTLARLHPNLRRETREKTIETVLGLGGFPEIDFTVSQISILQTRQRPGAVTYHSLADFGLKS